MGKNRLEAFSDGVIAIIITIMVLELKVPHGATFDTLLPLAPVLLSYVLSFIYVGIYWNKRQYVNYPSILNRKMLIAHVAALACHPQPPSVCNPKRNQEAVAATLLKALLRCGQFCMGAQHAVAIRFKLASAKRCEAVHLWRLEKFMQIHLRIPFILFLAALFLAPSHASAARQNLRASTANTAPTHATATADKLLANQIIDCSGAWLRYTLIIRSSGENVKEAYAEGGYYLDAGAALSSTAYAEQRRAVYRARYFQTMAGAETDADHNKLTQAAIPQLEKALDECAELRSKHSVVIESRLKEYYFPANKQAGRHPKSAFAAMGDESVARQRNKPLAKRMAHCAAVYSSKVMYQAQQTTKLDNDLMEDMQWYFARSVATSDEDFARTQFTAHSKELLKVVDGRGVPRKGVDASAVLNGYTGACEQLKAENPAGD